MRKFSRLAVMSLAIVSASSIFATGAGAATAGAGADSFGAQANAESLVISVAGTKLTGSSTTASLANDPKAAATASMILTPAFSPKPLAVAADVTKQSGVQAPKSCTGNELE